MKITAKRPEDSMTPFCLKYQNGWKINDLPLQRSGVAGKTITESLSQNRNRLRGAEWKVMKK